MQLTLHAELHILSISYMLVLIRALDEEGFHTCIGTGHLKLTSPQGEQVSCIPCI